MSKYIVGDTHTSFIFTKVLPIEELQMTFYELKHTVTGAKVMHLEADDPENLFCFSFKTLPSNSTGVAHILEHTVLCGSKKFPIKDPFFSMNRRSLNTFMNAMTGSDFTCYPAASQVEKDFYNLMEVYLDAIFFPNLTKMSFLQEGHRLEFEKENDSSSPLLFKGIVYNEMKGSLSLPESRLWQEIMSSLTPDLPYSFNSGGDPKEIPNLTHEELKKFHSIYYHPSHCLFFFYGNFPLEKNLDFIEKHVLKSAKKIQNLPPIIKQPRFKKPRYQTSYYPTQEKDSKEFINISWLTTDLQNQKDALSLAVLDSILMETDASPLKISLLKSGLCMQADGYLDLETSEIPYTIVCRGCEKDSAQKIEKIIFDTLRNIAEKGIKQDLIDAAIHQLEFNRLEITGDHGPFGLTLFFRSSLAAQHGCPPENALCMKSLFNQLQLLIKDQRYLPGLIQKYFLDNSHRVTLSFKPDFYLHKKEEQDEKERLSNIKTNLSTKNIDTLLKQTDDLKQYQDKMETQSIECLPKIGLIDVPKDAPDFPLSHEQKDQFTIFHHECFTNHILYTNLVFDLPFIPFDDLPYLQLFLSILPELGAGNRTYQENLEYINAYLGDFSASVSLFPNYENPGSLTPAFWFRGKALKRNADKLFSLFKDTCSLPHLDDLERIRELILQIHTSLENHLSRSAMSYAIQRSVSSFNPSAFIGEYWSGIKYFQFIRKLAKNLSENLPNIIEKLKSIKNLLFHFTNPHLILSCDKDLYRTLIKEDFYEIIDLPTKPYNPWKSPPISPSKGAQGFPISSPVAFSALGFHTTTTKDPCSPALSVSTDLLENTFLHKAIREQGGAYGSGASYNPVTGSYYFYGYRDPHIKATFKAFEEGISKIAEGKFTEAELIEAKLGLIQDFDSPLSPGNRAMTSYCYFRDGRNKSIRQQYRENLLNVKKQDIKNIVAELLLNKFNNSVKITFSGESHIKKDGIHLPIIYI